MFGNASFLLEFSRAEGPRAHATERPKKQFRLGVKNSRWDMMIRVHRYWPRGMPLWRYFGAWMDVGWTWTDLVVQWIIHSAANLERVNSFHRPKEVAYLRVESLHASPPLKFSLPVPKRIRRYDKCVWLCASLAQAPPPHRFVRKRPCRTCSLQGRQKDPAQ